MSERNHFVVADLMNYVRKETISGTTYQPLKEYHIGYVLNNTAVNGAVYVWGDYVILENSTYANNTAIDGAGLYIYGDYTEFNNVTVVHNIASNNGGGIFLNGDHVLINSVIGHDNYAINGGAIYCMGYNTTVIRVTLLTIMLLSMVEQLW